MLLPFARAKALEARVDEFLDLVAKAGLELKAAIRCYLEGDVVEFAQRIDLVNQLERRADEVRKDTEVILYRNALIPESRGDVLGLLESMDDVIDCAKAVLLRIDVERPDIPSSFDKGFVALTDACVASLDNAVMAMRAFFRAVHLMKDHINKVDHFESEADRAALRLKKQIFQSDIELSAKMHLRYFAEQVEAISDLAEHVAERLTIAAIKRSL